VDYQLIDSGNGQKLERFGKVTLVRPCGQALWSPSKSKEIWEQADASFSREGGNQWNLKRGVPEEWNIEVSNISFKLKRTDFGHLGIFPEQQPLWMKIQEKLRGKKSKVLNLFAYSGGSTLAAAMTGAECVHLDAAAGMVAWARENCTLNRLQTAPIRWIVDDALKFLARAVKREERYDAIIFDPPSFGRGKKGEVFKIEEDLNFIVNSCASLLSETPAFVLFTCHTPGFTPITMRQLLQMSMKGGFVDAGEMVLSGENTFDVPSGTYSFWEP
jgi:23S rRNA (cytosine1962-C5)-methyltransferase